MCVATGDIVKAEKFKTHELFIFNLLKTQFKLRTTLRIKSILDLTWSSRAPRSHIEVFDEA